MNDIEKLSQEIETFNQERDWDQFHSPANLAKSIAIESGELLECFQWNETDFDKDAVNEELADVLMYCFQLADKLGVDIRDIMEAKLARNAEKYPVGKAKGTSLKYDKLK